MSHPALRHMKPGDHYCGIFTSDEEHRAFVVDFVREGIRREEKMIYLVNHQSADQLCTTLSSAGIPVADLIAKRQLVIMTAREAYLKDGTFEPDKMIAILRDEGAQALADGYRATRCTGEMTWALSGEPGCERLVEYESLLNDFFPNSNLYAVCQYDRRRFDSELMLDILHTHPQVLCGMKAFDNRAMYYVPTDAFMERDRQTAILDTWLTNLDGKRIAP